MSGYMNSTRSNKIKIEDSHDAYQKVGVVILNYNSSEDTIRLCETLLKQEGTNVEIIIVDNNSSRQDKAKLRILASDRITVIENTENLGFARGNNVGIVYARNKLNCDFVFVINSDSLMADNNVIKTLISYYSEGVGLISPECYGFDKKTFQLPYCLSKGNSIKELIKVIALVVWQSIKATLNKEWSIHKAMNIQFEPSDFKYIIQGNAYILTPSFFEHYSMIFPRTFLYLEETALLWYLKKARLSTVYVTEAIVLHKEAGSNKKSNRKKEEYKAKEMRKSLFSIIPIWFMSERKILEKYNQ